ncbi:MAG: tetratricopeptide repeat protein [Kiritimatiellae bacterium]|nr:tetratricopeptide repeat protein [Kiritimatiellia bacterium]
MSKEKNTNPVTEEVPGWVKKAPELLPVWDWWVKEGRSTVTLLRVAGVCVAGWFAFKNWQAGRVTAANNALVNAFTADELEEAVAKFGSSSTGPALKLRLAKSYLDAERWEEAEKVYADYAAKAGADDPFVSLARLGHAYALEGTGKIEEALKEFESIASETNLPVSATAALGVARCMALNGDKDGAIKKLESSDDVRAKNLMEMIKRYNPNRKAVSLFDAADAAASKIAAEKAVEVKKDEVKPAEKAVEKK